MATSACSPLLTKAIKRCLPQQIERKAVLDLRTLNTGVNEITFISDNQAECNAARKAGLHTLFSLRDGNPDQDPGTHRVIRNLNEVLDLIRP